GIRLTVAQLERGIARVQNAYSRVVTEPGNEVAQSTIAKVFETTDRNWRGLGVIPGSGWKLTAEYSEFDAAARFSVSDIRGEESGRCRAGEVLRGAIKPSQCEAFGNDCTPRNPLGAPMVSGEGACAAYYQFGRLVHLGAR
ncbi:MAG: hydrogenase formation protein HypD, partial [Planctomycetota bacterium]